MDREQIKTELRQVFPPSADPLRLDRWLERLSETESCLHLAYCILIDVKTELVAPETFARVLELMDLDAANLVAEFGRAVDRMEAQGEALTWDGRLTHDNAHTPIECARVLEIGQFIRYCLPERPGTLDNSSLKRVRLTYFKTPEGGPLGRVTRVFSGGRRRVWVLPQEDLENLRKLGAAVIKDALGLPIKNGVGDGGRPELVAIIYPRSAALRSTQPTSLDATWTGGPCYFLPAKSVGGWGQTHSCSGSGPSCRERVHAQLDGLSNSYRGLHLGVALDLGENWGSVLGAAEARLNAVTDSGLDRTK